MNLYKNYSSYCILPGNTQRFLNNLIKHEKASHNKSSFCAWTFLYFLLRYLYTAVTKPKHMGYFLAKISSSITALVFPSNFSFYTSCPHHNFTPQVLSLQAGLFFCFRFCGCFTIPCVLAGGEYSVCWKDNKDFRLHAPLKSSYIGPTITQYNLTCCCSETKPKHTQYCRCTTTPLCENLKGEFAAFAAE